MVQFDESSSICLRLSLCISPSALSSVNLLPLSISLFCPFLHVYMHACSSLVISTVFMLHTSFTLFIPWMRFQQTHKRLYLLPSIFYLYFRSSRLPPSLPLSLRIMYLYKPIYIFFAFLPPSSQPSSTSVSPSVLLQPFFIVPLHKLSMVAVSTIWWVSTSWFAGAAHCFAASFISRWSPERGEDDDDTLDCTVYNVHTPCVVEMVSHD